ncbi:MAG TPA: acyl carrier protein [Solirubrobacteraceae bacterium]|jgi:acyl carrier protein|nr:acyl carrier protein [Solirubrobacteraceae bacterium]
MLERIKEIIRLHAHLNSDPATLPENADLYEAGMTSHSSVNVMLALEDAFDVEFPDHMLTRGVFGSMAAIQSALLEMKAHAPA